ncbi:MAG: UDP-3-O-(3-hydroxymyristoyl)glucosamine N-acyltransferase, partial [Crocosphaera sp.]
MKFQEIVEKLSPLVSEHSLTTTNENNPDITGVAAVSEAEAQQLSYIEGPK